ncbi:MAG: transporter [Rhodocyclaceae bacterium]|nr:transporter [Rhodocyclaceae bacterium]
MQHVSHRAAPMNRMAAMAILAAAFGTPAHAAHPLLTEDTGTQGEGKYQLELMVDQTRDHEPGVTMRERVTTAVLSYGLMDDVDLQFGLPHARQHLHDAAGRHASQGVLDATVDLKWRFLEREALSLGFKPGITLPTGDKGRGFGTGRPTWGALGILSYEPGDWAFHTHAGYRHNNNDVGQRISLKHLSAAVTYKATEQLKLVADLSADTNPDRADRGSLRYRILGLIYSPLPWLDLDVGWKHGHGRAAADRAFLIGAAMRW